MQRKGRASYVYIKVFLNANGQGPWLCEYCSELIHKRGRHANEGIIHHRDHNKFNDGVENLCILHARCHIQHHSIGENNSFYGKTHTPEMREHLANKQRGRKLSPETRAKMSKTQREVAKTRKSQSGSNNHFYGKTHTLEQKAMMRERSPCPVCGKLYNLAWMTRHKNEGKCVKSSDKEIS
jgi:uncharacterized Zn-finger protein